MPPNPTLKGLSPYATPSGLSCNTSTNPGLSGTKRRSTLGFGTMPLSGHFQNNRPNSRALSYRAARGGGCFDVIRNRCRSASSRLRLVPALNGRPEFITAAAAARNWGSAPTGRRHKAQGWPRFLRPTLEGEVRRISTLKGLRCDAIPSGLN